MIVLLDTSADLRCCAVELGCGVEQLLTPLTGFAVQYPQEHFAIDNGAFSGFDATRFEALLRREQHRQPLCRFVAVPDVVASARRTLEVFDQWWAGPVLRGWPLALVAQDGLEDLSIPWQLLSAVFVGGTTEWKLGPHARHVIKAAQILGKWVHVGRVNTPGRFEYCERLGVDSIDGTGLSRYTWMRESLYRRAMQPTLFSDQASQEVTSS